MILKNNTDKKALYEALRQDKKPYKNALSVYAKQSDGYKAYIIIRKYLHMQWLAYIDDLSWGELVAVDQEKWMDDKRAELGIEL